MKAGSDLAMLSCLTLFIFCFTTSLLQSLTPLIPGKCSVYSHIPLVYGIPNYTVLPSLLFFPSWPFSFFYFKYYFFYSNIFKSLSLPHIWFVGEDFLVPVKMNKETWILVSFFDINYLWDLEWNTCIICLDVKFTSAKYGVRKFI